MSFPPPNPGPFSAIGKIVKVDAVTKAKKSGGTFTINMAYLDTGVEVEFGFKPVHHRVGADVSWVVKKEYGTYRYVSDDPSAGSYPPALLPRGGPTIAPTAATPAPTAAPGRAPFVPKPFPLPRDHGDTAIIRQNALTNAVATHNQLPGETVDLEALTNSIIQLAYKYAMFSSGHMDEMLAAEIAERSAAKVAA